MRVEVGAGSRPRIGTLKLRGAGGEPVDLARTLASHGVATLPPQSVDLAARTLETTLSLGEGQTRTVLVRAFGSDRVAVEALPSGGRSLAGGGPAGPALPAGPGLAGGGPAGPGLAGGDPTARERTRILAVVRQMLSLGEDLSGFYSLALSDPDLAWASGGAGRMLRAPSVFEDVVKTVCTTNCSWSATERMVGALVLNLGAAAADGRRAFPGPATMAAAGEAFYKESCRAGYRSAYLVRLAEAVAGGLVDLEALRDPEMPDDEVSRRLLALPGVGPYAAAHVMLVALGRYGRLVLDSWTRPTYAALSGKKASDAAIERRFRRYGDYAGLAFWLYLTRRWIED